MAGTMRVPVIIFLGYLIYSHGYFGGGGSSGDGQNPPAVVQQPVRQPDPPVVAQQQEKVPAQNAPALQQREKPVATMTALDLLKKYNSNPFSTDAAYKDKRIAVSGVIGSKGDIRKDHICFTFTRAGLDVWMVQCFFRQEDEKSLLSFGNGTTVHVEGTYDGESKISLGMEAAKAGFGSIRTVRLSDCSVVSAKNPTAETMSVSNFLKIANDYDKDKVYQDRRIIVHGVISGIGRGNFSGEPYIEFKLSNPRTILGNVYIYDAVRCFFRQEDAGLVASLSKGQTVYIEGIYRIYHADMASGGRALVDCSIKKQ